MKIVGGERWKFIPQGQSAEISGYTLWGMEDIPAERGKGQRPVKIGMNDTRYEEIVRVNNGGIDKLIGRDVGVSYDRYGKAVSIEVLK